MKAAWNKLRTVALHYLRVSKVTDLNPEDFRERAQRAHDALMSYARKGLQIFGVRICTYNLHTLACRGHKQEVARGPASREKEFWLERKIQELKQRVKYRAKANPEAVLLNDLMVSMALEPLRAEDGHLQTHDELFKISTPIPTTRQTSLSSPLRDLLPPHTRSSSFDVKRRMAAHWQSFNEGDVSLWTYEDIEEAEYKEFKRYTMNRNGKEIVFHSKAYRRSAARLSYFVHVLYDFQGSICHHVAKIKKFLLLQPPTSETHLEDLPLALVDLYDATMARDGRNTLLRLLEVEDLQQAQYVDYPLKVGDIRETVIACLPRDSRKGYFILDDPDEDL